MTTKEAIAWVELADNSAELSHEDLEQVFYALYGRKPDQEDIDQGLWSHVCAWVETTKREAFLAVHMRDNKSDLIK